MFDIGWSEFLVIGVVALIAIGPKELPGVLRSIGQWTTKIKRMASDFQGQFNEAMREAEMADLKKHAEDLNSTAKSVTQFDPLASNFDPASFGVTPPAETPPAGANPVPPIDVGAPPKEIAATPPVSEVEIASTIAPAAAPKSGA